MFVNEPATDNPAQDVNSRIEEALNPQEELIENEELAVAEDDENLPDADDANSEDEDGSVDESDKEVSEEDLTLADYLGIDDDKLVVKDDGSVVVNAVVDGQASEVDLKELVKSYQIQGHVNNKSISLENDRKEFEQTRDQAFTELTTRLDGLNDMNKMLEEQLLGDYNSINWDTLRVQDPSEWAALKQEFAEKAQRIQQSKGLLAQEADRIKGEKQNDLDSKQAQYLQTEMNAMVADNPTWSDPAVMKAEVAEIGSFLKNDYGFSDDELKAVTDHRLLRLIKDAKAFKANKSGVADKKIVKPLPKFQKPGNTAKNAASLSKARAVKARKKAVKDSGGSTASIANSLIDRM